LLFRFVPVAERSFLQIRIGRCCLVAGIGRSLSAFTRYRIENGGELFRPRLGKRRWWNENAFGFALYRKRVRQTTALYTIDVLLPLRSIVSDETRGRLGEFTTTETILRHEKLYMACFFYKVEIEESSLYAGTPIFVYRVQNNTAQIRRLYATTDRLILTVYHRFVEPYVINYNHPII